MFPMHHALNMVETLLVSLLRMVKWRPGEKNYAQLVRNRPKSFCLNLAVCASKNLVHFRESVAVGGIYEVGSRM
jgi:hypothetical protein